VSRLKLNINNSKSIKMFNHCYQRACFHPKRRVRKKNYKRATDILYNSIVNGKTIIPLRKAMKLLLGNDKMKWLRWEVENSKETN